MTRKVYDSKGKLLYDNTWYSSYQGEKEIVNVGTKPKPKPKPKPTPTATDPSTYLPTELAPTDTTPTDTATTGPTG